jgi:hypothetical protein
MLVRFHCKTRGDVAMLPADVDRLLGAMGVAPAPQGILKPEAMAAARRSIEAAIEQDETAPAASPADDDAVSLRQRAWPLLEMMKAAEQEGAAIVWGG